MSHREHAGVRMRLRVLHPQGACVCQFTFLGVPCVTVRTTTERPITVAQGTNRSHATGLASVGRPCRRACGLSGGAVGLRQPGIAPQREGLIR